MIRILNWHFGKEQPSYYIERDYTPDKVRIYATNAPSNGDCEVDIRDDGVSIFADRTSKITTGTVVNSLLTHAVPTGAFTVGESISGGTSNATGIILASNTKENYLEVRMSSDSSFSDAETITGASSGYTAVVHKFVRGGISQVESQADAQTTAILAQGDNLNEMAEDFLSDNPPIAAGSIVTCHLIKSNGAGDITVQLELKSMDDEDEISE